MPTPVVFLAFSNDIENPLSALAGESRHIYQALAALEDRRILRVFREESAGTEDILDTLRRIGDPENDYRLVLFHYAGHADSDHIQLIDGEGNATGLAQLLAQFKEQLGVVFLNGCSTQPQVELLLELGIPAVIATNAPIADHQSSQFARQFYSKLASNSTLEQAFDFAAASLQFRGQRTAVKQEVSTRGIKLPGTNAPKTAELPWGLYYAGNELDGASPPLEWRFPAAPAGQIQRPRGDLRVNEFLLDVAYAMADYQEDLKGKLDAMSDGELYELIIREFPWLISAQIRSLIAKDDSMREPTPARLEQIISTYLAAGQLLYFTMLSRLWDLRFRGIITEIHLEIDETFGLRSDNFLLFDFFAHTKQLIDEIQSHPDAGLFVEELGELRHKLKDNQEFAEAYRYLESKKEQLAKGQHRLLEAEIYDICLEAEYALSIILCQIAFYVNYQMVTVREIQINKPRHREAFFQHYLGKLHAHMESSIAVSTVPRVYPAYLDSRSVLLLRDLEHPDPFLNLTPFIIDKNAFGEAKDQATNLFTFAYAEQPEGADQEEYVYLMSSRNLLQWAGRPCDNLHKFHTGYAPEPERRRSRRRGPAPENPYAGLREQFLQLRKDW